MSASTRRGGSAARSSGVGMSVGGVIVVISRAPGAGSWASARRAAASSAMWPVRLRNTSSSDGRRSPRSATAMREMSSARTASTSATEPWPTGTCTRAELAVDDELTVADVERVGERPDGALGVGAIAQREVHDVAADPGLELVGGALGDDAAAVDDADAIGELVGLLHVLGGEDDRRALLVQAADHVPELQPAAGVESGRGLVEEQHRRAPPSGWPRGRGGGASRRSRCGAGGRRRR